MQSGAFCTDATDRNSSISQTLIGIVCTQLQTILGARGKHTIGFADTARDEVIDHYAKVSLRTIDDDFAALTRQSRSIQARKKPLRRGLFITCGAIDLAGQKQTTQSFCLQRRRQLTRVDVVVFDRISRTNEARTLQSWNRRDQSVLHVFRKRRGNSIRIDRVIVETFWLQKYLVPVPLAELHNFVFDCRTITR